LSPLNQTIEAGVPHHRGKDIASLGAQKKRSQQNNVRTTVTPRRKQAAIVQQSSPETTVEESILPTGKTSPRKKRTADQIEQDLIRKPVNGCNHSDEDNPLLAEWATWNAGYYTDAHQKKMNGKGTKFPKSCAGKCKKKFVGGGVKDFEKDKHCKVTASKPVRLCPNASNPKHQCTFGLCTGCYNVKVLDVAVNTMLQAQKDGKGNKRPRRGGNDSTGKTNKSKEVGKRGSKRKASIQ
jgi:hypothetical protein